MVKLNYKMSSKRVEAAEHVIIYALQLIAFYFIQFIFLKRIYA